MIQRLFRIQRVTTTTAVRRAVKGPRHPSWSWRYELTLALLRSAISNADKTPHVARAAFDRIGTIQRRRRVGRWEVVDADGVRAVWLTPREHDDRVLVWLHGGAYVVGAPETHRALLGALARRARARVFAVDYRLAPEHPCPAAIDDAVAALRWLYAQGVSPAQVVLGGDSAGGGLSLTTLVALREAGVPLPGRVVLLSPWTDLTCTTPSLKAFEAHDYLGPAEGLDGFAAHYAGALDRRDPRVSPLYADLRGLPPTLVVAGGAEMILDDSTRVADRLRDAGVEVLLHVEPGEVHVYPALADLTPRGKAGLELVSSWVRAAR